MNRHAAWPDEHATRNARISSRSVRRPEQERAALWRFTREPERVRPHGRHQTPTECARFSSRIRRASSRSARTRSPDPRRDEHRPVFPTTSRSKVRRAARRVLTAAPPSKHRMAQRSTGTFSPDSYRSLSSRGLSRDTVPGKPCPDHPAELAAQVRRPHAMEDLQCTQLIQLEQASRYKSCGRGPRNYPPRHRTQIRTERPTHVGVSCAHLRIRVNHDQEETERRISASM